MLKTLSVTILLAGLAMTTHAQDAASKSEKAKTKLETFLSQDGVVVVQGISTIGVASGQYGTSVAVESKELTNASTLKKEYGITIEVKETTRIARDHTSYVDYDEIDSILKGLDYISKLDKSVTKLDGFQADYRTRGNLKFSVFSNKDGSNMLAVESGTIGATSAYFKSGDISKLRDLIVSAKQKLDSIK